MRSFCGSRDEINPSKGRSTPLANQLVAQVLDAIAV
jgi:hypothetical protein